MKLLLIQNIQESESDILLAASATNGMGYGLEEQTILWVHAIYAGKDSLGSSLAYMPCESVPPWQNPKPWYRQSLLKKTETFVIPTEIFVSVSTTSSFDRSFLPE